MRIKIFFILIFLIVLSGVTYLYYDCYNKKVKTVAYAIIDVNPSIELGVNSEGNVVEVESLNEDADIVMNEVNVIGQTLEQATSIVVDNLVDTGYINEIEYNNVITVNTYSDDENLRQNTESKIYNNVERRLKSRNIPAYINKVNVTDEIKAEATNYGISNGKMLLITKAIALNPSLNKNDLVGMSVQDIQKQIKADNTNRKAELKKSMEQLKVEYKAKKEQLISTAKVEVQQEKEQIWEKYKTEVKNADYSQKEAVIEKAIQERKTITRNAIDQVKQELKNEREQTKAEIQSKLKEKLSQKVSQDR